MEMETLPDTAWPPGSKCKKNFTGSSLSSSTHNGHSDDEEIVDIDDDEDISCDRASGPPLQKGSMKTEAETKSADSDDDRVASCSPPHGTNFDTCGHFNDTSSYVERVVDKMTSESPCDNIELVEEEGEDLEEDEEEEVSGAPPEIRNSTSEALPCAETVPPPSSPPRLAAPSSPGNSGSKPAQKTLTCDEAAIGYKLCSTARALKTPEPLLGQSRKTPELFLGQSRKPPEPFLGQSPKTLNNTVSKFSGLRSLPIHCVIEQEDSVNDVRDFESNPHARVVVDTYAILPGATLFFDLVTASLLKLGYTAPEAVGAKGGLQLKNWKTLTFADVTDNPLATVEEILGELTSVATLRIRLRHVRVSSTSEDVKEKLLQLLLTKSKDFLLQAGCPIEKSLLETIATGEISQHIPDQVCSLFDEWYTRQKGDSSPLSVLSKHSTPAKPQQSPPLSAVTSLQGKPQDESPLKSDSPMEFTDSPVVQSLKVDQPVIKTENLSSYPSDVQEALNLKHHLPSLTDTSPIRNKIKTEKMLDKNSLKDFYKISRSPSEGNIPSTLQSHPSNPYLGLMPGKTRIRTSFDPEHEIPRLQKWFMDNQHPTREQMMRFMQELNGLESRKGRRPLDLTNIIYWFKNARAAQRRASKALDDSFENEENVDMNSAGSANSVTECVPPYLPNKNAVYMIPFHPYPHLLTDTSAAGADEPYDLSLTKRPSDMSKMQNGKDKDVSFSDSATPSPIKSSPSSSEGEGQGDILKKKKPYCTQRFPALLDVASKLRQEIPPRSNDIFQNMNTDVNNGRMSPFRSGSSDMERSSRQDETDTYSDPSTPLTNGGSVTEHYLSSLKIKHEHCKYSPRDHNSESKQSYLHASHISRESSIELGQIKKEQDKIECSDDENSNDSYNSEEELKLRLKQSAAVVDYASAMHNNVSRLTAANMAALSLAQMGQSLHIPQLPPSLAMAYYPMDHRFYSQTSVQHSLSSSPLTSLSANHASHLSQLSLRQDSAPHDARSPLPSPSMQQSINHLAQHQRQSPQQPHHRHHSEPRKRRTRVFIDPLTEIPKLEKWFTEDTHPSAFMIDKYCEELNKCEYRHKFPKLEPKNVQLWFKNHRAKVKRMKVSFDGQGDPDGSMGLDDDMDD